ncbi:monocarboxylate transporter 9 [Belonocnema kinseyi]|uniref:monocarboxylate transporter 9 n=1 Tax=Belonocnema kinseyi TaxID=2817044 RepID=UPI00143D1073|nr:monocarboxylate transporter 9 [Belonocnema kinseyi]XP_033228378.1 monocarboxylate transporter 9 [Belonocnema kinseyi]
MAHSIPVEEKKRGNGKLDELQEVEENDSPMQEISEKESQPPPPDGGWGWVVVFGSFMIHIVTDGVTYSFGVLFEKLINYFDEGTGATAWIVSILVGVTLCSGPIASVFVDKYGCRPVTIAGAMLASICFLLSMWAQNIITLCFTIGIGAGFGFGLIYLPAIVSVTCYFEKYRSLATGIAVCGSGLGTLVFTPLLEYLVTSYGWRGSMIIIGGIVLNCIFFGILFRPLEPVKKKEFIPMLERPKKKETETQLLPTNGFQRPHSVSNVNSKYLPDHHYTSSNNIKVALSQPTLITKNRVEHGVKSFGSGIMNRRDIFYQGSVDNFRKHESLVNSVENMRFHESSKSLPNGTKHNSDKLEQKKKSVNIFKQMMEFSLLKDPIFIIFTLSNFFTSIGFYIPFYYLSIQAQDKGLDNTTSKYLIEIIGVANTLGRIVLGYLSDKPWINRLLVYNICLTVCGVATAFSTFCVSFGAFAFYAIIFGFTAGAYVGLTSVILVDLLGLDRLTNAFGLLLLFQGIASFLGPPIGGWLKDLLKTVDPAFYLAGIMIALSGLMLFSIPPVQRWLRLREAETNKDTRYSLI